MKFCNHLLVFHYLHVINFEKQDFPEVQTFHTF